MRNISSLQALIALASTPAGCPLDEALMVGPMLDDSGSGTVNLVTWTEAQAARNGGGGAALSELYMTLGMASEAVAEPAKPRGGKRGKKDASSTAPTASSLPTTAAATLGHARPDMVVGMSGEGSAVRMRLATAQALGQLLKSVHNHVSDPVGGPKCGL